VVEVEKLNVECAVAVGRRTTCVLAVGAWILDHVHDDITVLLGDGTNAPVTSRPSDMLAAWRV
jgi:hypothetical protein